MLFPYPEPKTELNWLHQCLLELTAAATGAIERDENLPDWKVFVPPSHQAKVARRTGLEKRVAEYLAALQAIGREDRQALLKALAEQNALDELLDCRMDCAAIGDIAEPVREPVKALYEFCFGLLTDLGIRDERYSDIYQGLASPLCPACGCEYFDSPGGRREAWDHYLLKSKYPFAGVNLRNLLPMGFKCNSAYKREVDILRRTDGSRRRAFNPYTLSGPRICLEASEPFGGTGGELPAWKLEFEPDSEEVETWNDVFAIRQRYIRDILEPSFKSWLAEFAVFARAGGGSKLEMSVHIDGYVQYLEASGWTDRAFLKAAVFRMLRAWCDAGNDDVREFLQDVVG